MEPIVVISILGGLILLVLFMGAPMRPVRFIGQGLVKIMIGALLLFFLNAFGTTLGLNIPINLVTSTISGFLGVPGIAALVIIDTFILG
ncbi:pro-sigmaK processing inhibitor BofA family protein [Bacillus luteolus]|uniref:Pro-sigmaK processing inhibitor BofA family protein n=1 Tax=Litchfieldia luteola TaxID=682179 RepID=A0ABR9QH47_9BACI|nr:pro-sigmaK processing inhibitor BofA family protein [Cytobacillus luteolus]MBE4907798.1 pro-sigmaK processing inhibitor BofA family protein [Cytobacillus luteolus]MBP1944609.1 inhibitor of the pro-sigma K processing machinery [Cytobacillus luteolus]